MRAVRQGPVRPGAARRGNAGQRLARRGMARELLFPRGLAEGFRQAAERSAEFGEAMRTMAQGAASGVERAFKEGFSDVLAGRFKARPKRKQK
jgi:hypothetical protein